MGEYLAPYKNTIEGFTDPSMASVFQELLQVNVPNARGSGTTKISFLNDILQKEQDMADSLYATAKNLSPVAQKSQQVSDAYDAGFEIDTSAELPGASKTLQGFTLLFFFVSYFALAIVLCIQYYTYSDPRSLLKTLALLGSFVIGGAFLASVIQRYG